MNLLLIFVNIVLEKPFIRNNIKLLVAENSNFGAGNLKFGARFKFGATLYKHLFKMIILVIWVKIQIKPSE